MTRSPYFGLPDNGVSDFDAKEPEMNGYIGFYKGKRAEVLAATGLSTITSYCPVKASGASIWISWVIAWSSPDVDKISTGEPRNSLLFP